MTDTHKNPFKVLGISPYASIKIIKKRYRYLVLKHHPDRFSENQQKEIAEEKLKTINIAYAIVSDPKKREGYFQDTRSKDISRYPRISTDPGNVDSNEMNYYRPSTINRFFLTFNGKIGFRILSICLFIFLLLLIIYFLTYGSPQFSNKNSLTKPYEIVPVTKNGTNISTSLNISLNPPPKTKNDSGNSGPIFRAPYLPADKVIFRDIPFPNDVIRDCKSWDKVSKADSGTNICVYGTIRHQARSEKGLNLMFSDDPGSFQFISYGNWSYVDIEGNCVLAVGSIEYIEQTLGMIIVKDQLMRCR